eukprot:3553579-Rhodomonas_salina.2
MNQRDHPCTRVPTRKPFLPGYPGYPGTRVPRHLCAGAGFTRDWYNIVTPLPLWRYARASATMALREKS